ncbi:hypothetical protein [Rhodopila sp.]|uniref:hypothetical protein n=1 Tax=Rhodopila sp. TaxID=2480087 RepID=UPI003D0BD697
MAEEGLAEEGWAEEGLAEEGWGGDKNDAPPDGSAPDPTTVTSIFAITFQLPPQNFLDFGL